MNPFSQWQENFASSLFSGLTKELQTSFLPLSEEAQQKRFSIYQNNVFYSLSNALADLYPVVKKLVGDDFFAGTAHFFLKAYPPSQAAMVHFGQNFSTFLSEFEHTKTLPYLADVAILELAHHRAYHAKDSKVINAQDIATINPDTLALAQVELHPSMSMIESKYPILTIWQSNQGDENVAESINMNEPQQVLVVRPLYDVMLYSLEKDIYHFIDLLRLGKSLQNAIEETINIYGDFDASSSIHFLLEAQLMSHIQQ